MAVQQLQIPSSNINNLVDQSTWAGIGNLGNVYREAQERDKQQATLAQLGTDPAANIGFLMKSGNPALVQMGLRLQQQQTENSRADAELNIRKAAEARAQGDYEQADKFQKEAARLNERVLNAATGQGTPSAPGAPTPFPGAASPFGAPGQTALPPAVVPPPGSVPPAPPSMLPPPPAAAPTIAAVPAPAPTQAPAQAAPVPPSPAPPIKAADENTGLPDWAGPQSTAGRMLNTLTKAQPTAVAGINNADLAKALVNPYTKDLAKVFAQNKLDPGTWTVHHDEGTGQFIAFNSKDPTKTMNVTPGGGTGMSKQEAEYNGYLKAGLTLFNGDEAKARAWVANNRKTPSDEDLTVDQRKTIEGNINMIRAAQSVVNNIDEMKTLSPKATGSPIGKFASDIDVSVLPGAMLGQTSLASQKLANLAGQNAAEQVKGMFGARVTNLDLNFAKSLQGTLTQSDPIRQEVYDRAKANFEGKIRDLNAENDAIRSKQIYKPGYQPPRLPGSRATPDEIATATPGGVPVAPTAKPSLGEFMAKARAANPGYSDGEIAREWKKRYGS